MNSRERKQGVIKVEIGVLAHLCGKRKSEDLAKRIASHGFTYVQLALWKAIEGFDFTRPGQMSPGLANHIAEAFAKQGVSIPVLGCYLHLYSQDAGIYRQHLDRFKEHLRHARSFGASIVAVEVGKPEPDSDEEENGRRLYEGMSELVEEAEKWGVYIGIEPANDHLIDTPDRLCRLWETIPSSVLGAVLDPANLLKTTNIDQQDDVMRMAFDRLGERIVSMHAKDVKPTPDSSLEVVAPGRGALNYELYLQLADAYKPKSYMTLERTPESEMADAVRFIRENRKRR